MNAPFRTVLRLFLATLAFSASAAFATDYGPYYCPGCGDLTTATGVDQGITWMRSTGFAEANVQAFYTSDSFTICDGSTFVKIVRPNAFSSVYTPSTMRKDTGGYKNPQDVPDVGSRHSGGVPVARSNA